MGDTTNLNSIDRCLQVSIPVKSSGRAMKFGDIERLRGKYITGVEATRLAKTSVDINGAAVTSDATFEASFLTLRTRESDLQIDGLPLTSISRADNSGNLTKINYKLVDWVNSQIDCGDSAAAAASATANEVYLFTIYYSDSNKKSVNRLC